MHAIEARGLTKSFRGVRAVDDLGLLVDKGEVVTLLDPNGAGKTTTLMMVLGIMEPDAGSVRILGHPLPEERSSALHHTNFTASYVSLPSDLPVRHYLWVFADIYGVPRVRAQEVLELFGVGPCWSVPPRTCRADRRR